MDAISRARSFNGAAERYAANRPSYPPALLDAVEELAGRPLAGSRVVDVGAGTGIATALLDERGAHVVAVEPGQCMAVQFRRGHPDLPIVRGDGNALPVADASADFLTYAQSWHWTNPERSVPEAVRVLRPGGALALWWNVADQTVPWLAEQDARVRRLFGAGTGAHGSAERVKGLTGALDFAVRRVPWRRRVTLEKHLANLGSHSIFLVLGAEGTSAFLDEERAELLKVFPDGVVDEAYMVELLVALRPA